MPKPAVVEYEQLDAESLSGAGDVFDFISVEAEIRGFPVVDQYRTRFVAEQSAHKPLTVQPVVRPGHAADSLVGIDEHRFRRLEAVTRLKQPLEAERIDPHGDTGRSVLVHLRFGKEVAAVHQIEAVGFTAVLPGIRGEQGEERILLVAARPPLAVNTLPAGVQRSTDNMPFPGPRAGEVQQLIIGMREIQRSG